MTHPDGGVRIRASLSEAASSFDSAWWLGALSANDVREPANSKDTGGAPPARPVAQITAGTADYSVERLDDSPDSVSVIRCVGEVDLATAAPLGGLIDDEISAGRSRLVVDLSETRYVDSTALCLLIGAYKRCRQAHGEMRLVCTSNRIRTIFSATRLTTLFRLFPTLALALHAQWA